ncbi:hypothetical protein TNCV_1766581 [Trichonephila clavipes]|nr:hypothetical protein TNCV_1766581 [Trichonephila clavipes]
MKPDRQCQIEAHKIHRDNGARIHLSFGPQLLAPKCNSEWFHSLLTKFLSRTIQGFFQVPPTYLQVSPILRENFRLGEYLECPSAAQALLISKQQCLFRDSNPAHQHTPIESH